MKTARLNSHNSINSLHSHKALSGLSDDTLVSRLEKLRGEERAVQLEILYHLGEMERRRLYLPRGYSSLFEFCTGHLKYSRSAAGRRIRATRCVQKIPTVAKLLLSGDLNLCVVSLLSDILTRENCTEILSKVKGRSYRDIEMLVSRHRPGRMTRDRIKPVCIMTPVTSVKSECKADLTFSSGAGTKCKADLSFSPNVGSKCKANFTSGQSKSLENKEVAENSPSGEELERVILQQKFRLEFAVDPEFMQKLEKIRSLLSSTHPRGIGFEKLFELLMDEYLENHAPESRIKKRAERKRRSQNTKAPDTRTRHIPKALRDKVHARDKGRCTYIGQGGKQCDSRWNLQVDHIVPYAKGGTHTLDNLRLLCAKHNRLEAEREYGKEFMIKYHVRESSARYRSLNHPNTPFDQNNHPNTPADQNNRPNTPADQNNQLSNPVSQNNRLRNAVNQNDLSYTAGKSKVPAGIDQLAPDFSLDILKVKINKASG